jgi:hypothetical protein
MALDKNSKYYNKESSCNCSDEPKEKNVDNFMIDTYMSKRIVRSINIPSTTLKSRLFDAPEPLSEISIQSPGSIPIRVIAPTNDITPELIKKIENQSKDFPRLETTNGRGAVDIMLENEYGTHVKRGFILLENDTGKIGINIDPRTRRFRIGNLVAGKYLVKGYSIDSGNGSMRLTIREGDVTRSVLKLDGSAVQGTGSLRIQLKGTNSTSVKVRATDKLTGKIVFDKAVKVDSASGMPLLYL